MSSGSNSNERSVIRSTRVVSTRVQPSESRTSSQTSSQTTTRVHPESRTVTTTRVVPAESRTVTTTRVVPSESRTFTTTRVVPSESRTFTTTRVVPSESRTVSHTTRVVKQVSSSSKGGKTVTETTVTSSKSAAPQLRTVTRTTTRVVASPTKKAKISDIITGLSDETVTAREALLKWAQRTTERYPGVRITDFTNSWKDGLAFNAILHRNKPDLLDFRSLRTRSAKDNLELAFSIAEKEFGITRLLDPEDVDTPEPDEKSLITYISSIYDVFQEPPAYHPFADEERNRKIEEYKDIAKSLHIWMHESLQFLCCQKSYTTLIDLKSMLLESSKFRSEEMPKHSKDKQRLAHLHREIEKMSRETSHVEFLNDLKLEEIEKKWNLVVNTLQERDKKIRDEISKLEKLQKSVEKFNRESKICDGKLDDLERKIKDEEKRVQRLHLVDAKHNCDQIENELKQVDELLKSLKKDIAILEEKKYHQTSEMKIRLGSLRDRYQSLLTTFQSQLQSTLALRNGDDKKLMKEHVILNDKSPDVKTLCLKEHFEWIEKKYKRLNQIEFGVDYPSVKSTVEQFKQENKTIEQYNKKIVACSSPKLSKENDAAFTAELQNLQYRYKELVQFSLSKVQEAEGLLDFVQSATRELKWMNDKEDIEVSRDWSAKNLNLGDLEHHQEILTSDLEKREIQFNAIQSRGESLLLQKHPASKCIEGFLTKMQSQWSWLLQLTLCLEIHLRHAQTYHQYFKEVRECEQWIKKTEEKLNTTFSKSIFSIDEGEKYLKEMQEIKEDLAKYNSVIVSLLQRSSEILPLKLRRGQPSKPFSIVSICSYKSSTVNLCKDDKYTLKDASQKVMWKVVSSSGNESLVPGVCFIIPPPNSEALESGKSLKKKYDDILSLWALKQRKLRQNLILATIKVVKSWDISQLHCIDICQRESIMKALNADAEKLLCEGSSSEPALIKLKEEIEQCNVTFNSLVKKLSEDETEKSPKSAGRKLSDTVLGLQNTLNEKEKFLRNKLLAPIVWDMDSLENQVIEHKEFETGLKMLDEQISQFVETYKNTNRKTTALQMKYDTLVNTWNKIWELSNSYIEKLKVVDVAMNHLNDAIQTVSNIEVQLASCDKMSSNIDELRKLHENLLSFQADMQQSQSVIDDVQESAKKVRDLVHKIRPKQSNHTDVNKYENDVKKLLVRWNNARSQIIERLRSCGATSELLQTYNNKYENDNFWISETTIKVNSLKSVKRMTTKEIDLSVEPTMNLYSNIAERSSSIEGTNTLAARYIREAKAAIEENYKVCEENSAKLTSWMNDIEEKLAEIGILKEHLPGLQHQMNTVKVLKDELENQQHLVLTCLDQMRQLAQRGLEVLDKEEINTLQKNLISLKRQYDSLLNESDRLLRRLLTAVEELQKFKSELNNLKIWLVQAEQEFKRKESLLGSLSSLENNSEVFRNFTNDVIAHQADLRFITMAAQKFINESQEYLKALNAFRMNLPKKLSPLKVAESEVKSEVHEITTAFHNFLNNVNRLHDNFMIISNKYRCFTESTEKANIWLVEIEKSSKKSLEEPIADEPRAVQEQLDKIKLINMEVVGQSRLVENVLQSAKLLSDTLDNANVVPIETKSIEDSINYIQKAYSNLINSIAVRIKELQTALIQSQDIQDAVDRIMKWLEETENAVKINNRPVSLVIEKLDEQVQDFKILKSDVDNQKQSIDMLFTSAQELNDSTNPKLVKKVDAKLKDVSQRFEKLSEKILKRGSLLEEVSESVRVFQSMAVQFDEWSTSTVERIESTDSIHQMDLDGFSSVIEYTLNQCNSRKEDFESMIGIGKTLITKRDIVDIAVVKDKIQTLEQRWKNVENMLNEKKLLGKAKADQIAAYDSLRTQVLDWLLKMEREVEKLEPLALDQVVLKKQLSEITPLVKEHSDFSSAMEKLNSLGNACDVAIKGETSKQKVTSPLKKGSSPTRKSPSKSKSTDSFSVSPVKGQVSAQSPLSTVSSGFSSRRSSSDNIGSMEELTPIQFQMSEMNDRYSILGVKLSDRNQEINSITEEVKSCLKIVKSLSLFLEEKEKQMPKEGLPSKEAAEKHLKYLKGIQDEFLEKQPELDNLKTKTEGVLNKRKMVKGAAELEDDCNKIDKKWLQLILSIKQRISFLQDLKEFQETQLTLKNWLAQKQKMFGVLGPIASDPRMIVTQVQQVQVMRDEFTSQQIFMDRLNALATTVTQFLNMNNLDSNKIDEQMDNVHKLWNDMSTKLNEREDNLKAASGVTKDFHKNLTELQSKLQQHNEKFDKFDEKGFSFELYLKKIVEMEDELEKLRPLLTDADSVCEQLCEMLSDSASKTEIKYKVNILETSYTTLKKKIDNKKAEIESSLKEDNTFFKCCTDIQNWITETESLFCQPLSLSANFPKLAKQCEDYEPIYKQIMNREYEVHLCLNKGNEMLTKLTVKQDISALQTKLDNIKKSWEKLKKTAVGRNTSLRSALETCKKYSPSIEAFLPWLESEEQTFVKCVAASLQRDAINKQLKDLQSVKSNISVHLQEYENLLQLGENLLSVCELDKDSLKKELDNMKKRWKKLNDSVANRTQSSEDILQMFMDYEEKVRDLQHSLQRLEDRLSSHDALGDVSHDTILLDRLQALLAETKEMNKEIKKVKDFCKRVVEKGGPDLNSSEIVNTASLLEKRYQSLLKDLEDRCISMQASHKVISIFMESVKSLKSEINVLDEGFDKMSPVARDQKLLQDQFKEIKAFKSNLSKFKEKLAAAGVERQKIITEQHVSESNSYIEQIIILEKLIIRLEERVKSRESAVETMIGRFDNYLSIYTTTMKSLQLVLKEEESFEVIGGDVDRIRSQQQAFKEFRESKVLPLNKQIGEVNKLGQGLVQSATAGVNTSNVEQQLEKLNSLWNKLQESINEREKKLDIALLQSGKFQEALIGVEKWLTDTEEMVSNQKGPSSDFKVVKAQIQEQKFLKKMLLDRQSSVISLKTMGTELTNVTKTAEFQQAEKLMKSITVRFEELISSAERRMSVLEKTIPLAQEFQNLAATIQEWLEITEKKLLAMSSVPTDEERLKALIVEQKKLKEDISSHAKPIENLKSISEKLIKIINADEAEIVRQNMTSITNKYSEIKQNCENNGSLLKDAEKGIGNFTTSYTTIITWIETTMVQLTSYQILSISSDKLRIQIKELKILKNKLESERTGIGNTIKSGEKIMKLTSGEDSIQIKEKLDALNMKLTEISNRLNERLKTAEASLPLVETFFSANSKLTHWLEVTERTLKVIESNSLDVQDEAIKKLETGVHEYREVLEVINHTGPRLCELSPGEGAASIEGLITRANQRFERVSEQVQRKAERIRLAVQRKYDVVGDIDELYEWFQETEKHISDTEGLTSEPDSLLVLLNKQKALNEEVNGQKTRAREVVTAAKKLMRESSSEDLSFIHEKIEKLKSQTNCVSNLCHERISTLEQALPLAEHFFETHTDLGQWLDEVEGEAELLEAPGLYTVQIKKQQDKNKGLIQSVQEHKPLVDKLNKTGSALTKLCKEEESDKLEVILESDNSRYNALRKILREHQIALEEALQATSQFSDKLEGMLNALTSTADQLHNAEPISAHPERIQEQINENKVVLQDLDKRTITLEAVKKAADDVIVKASSIDEPAVRDIKVKLDRLNDLWETIQAAAKNRGKSLEEALVAAEKFWEELTAVMDALKDLQGSLNAQEPPAVEPAAVQQQREVLQELQEDISQREPEVDQCRQAGQDLLKICGEPDKLEVQRHIEDLDSVWENVTTLYVKREENLILAMEKAMMWHETLQSLVDFLGNAEKKFETLGAVSSDIESVKDQINQLKVFKLEVDPHMIEVETLNRQGQELMGGTTPTQATAIRVPLLDINKRWDNLLKNIVERQQEMEKTLLRLGQFQHALDELIVWITKTEKTLDELKPVVGDPQVIEVVLAKHKVIENDILAHQTSIDAINRAGYLDSDQSGEDAKSTHSKLANINCRWQNLQQKASLQYIELESALREAQQFHQNIQDFLSWLSDIDGQLVPTKPVGGLPETAKEQLNIFMELYDDLDSNRHQIESIMSQGDSYLKRSGETSTKSLQHNLQMLKQKWENTLNKANDRKIKLEIALREAIEFHEALQEFVEWLTNAEKYLTTMKSPSRHMITVLKQIEDHRNFQRDVGAHREVMINLEKKGNHLKYFSQKQDVILIKNLLMSVQHRWEKVVSKAAERTRQLDYGYKEAKEFNDAWTFLSSWLDEAEKQLDSTTPIGNDPAKIKKLLMKHKEFQRTLGSKQITYDSTMKSGRILKDKCSKEDVPQLQSMMNELKSRWNKVCTKSVDRQRKLEEALLHSGQFKDAVLALIDWLDKAITSLGDTKPYHGDLDTVTALIDQHKTFEEELKNRGISLDSACKTAIDLKKEASPSDIEDISSKVDELNSKWKKITELNEMKKKNLAEALHKAEELHKMVHILLEWLSDAEMKLRFVGSLPEDDDTTVKQIADHEAFMAEMKTQETLKINTLELANTILKICHPDGISIVRHWITIIQSRWDEIRILSVQRNDRLKEHLLSLRDILDLQSELLLWLKNCEAALTELEAHALPDDMEVIEALIKEHQSFMNSLTKRQGDVDKVQKSFSSKRAAKGTSSSVKDKPKDKLAHSATPTSSKTLPPLRTHADSDIKHPAVKELIDKWHHVWLLAMERQRRLQDKRNYLLELDRMKHFDFNDWRSRFLGYLNNKKSRIMDLFKKIDKYNHGKVTKQEFVQGILKSKFCTSQLEMECVVEVFDRNGDGFIDSKEYIDTLRPERESEPKTDAEKILDEVQRQVAKCTCVHRFKVYQVGEGKYRFGDSQKLRLVRILRSTVMVRVGGGWVALDEFLVKNDPCRAKGRLNIELREQFILADGVSQSMAPFKPKPTPNSSVSSQSGITMTNTGPITKIREKSERSTPMRQSRSSAENSSDISGASFSETDSFSNRSGTSRNTASSHFSPRNLSFKSSSRPGSQPSSRAPSDLSQDAVEKMKDKRVGLKKTTTLSGSTKKQVYRSPRDQPLDSAKLNRGLVSKGYSSLPSVSKTQGGSRSSSRAPSDLSQDAVENLKNKGAVPKRFSFSPSSSKSAKSVSDSSKIPSAKRPAKKEMSSKQDLPEQEVITKQEPSTEVESSSKDESPQK